MDQVIDKLLENTKDFKGELLDQILSTIEQLINYPILKDQLDSILDRLETIQIHCAHSKLSELID